MAKYEVSIDGRQYEVEIVRDDGRRAVLMVDGREYEVDARNVSSGSAPAANPPPKPSASAGATRDRGGRPPVPANPASAAAGPGVHEVRAPMPGLVLQVCASVGQRVESGHALFRLEAMKMENDVQSQSAGTVKEILVAQGDEVQEGEILMVLES